MLEVLTYVLTGMTAVLSAFLAYWARNTDLRLNKLEAAALPVAERLAKLEAVLDRIDKVLDRLEKRLDRND